MAAGRAMGRMNHQNRVGEGKEGAGVRHPTQGAASAARLRTRANAGALHVICDHQ
ncbi:hypothetical protein LMG26411_02120 [Cupriavidus numazuensis]|uniref:Uncharacterized protein n=1 Tax=Cupriavidus numazuensis TaxID=221992 RepID=A0ABN7PVJ6_9BURK|nr:hypothetical protein LMG26411_02120 [Cupriavidus numazuensis]